MKEYTFNISKKIVKRKKEETKVVLGELLPSPFFVETEIEERDIVSNAATLTKVVQGFYKRNAYSQISARCTQYIAYFSTSLINVKLIHYIADKLKFSSNKIIINPSDPDLKLICVNESHLSRHINELVANNIIAKTTKRGIYVVNHEMIFKGSYSDFIRLYIDFYKDFDNKEILDNKGRVVLDNNIDYGK